MTDHPPTERQPQSSRSPRFFHRARMEYWAFVAQIVSALAVIVSLVFVGLQLRDGNLVAIRSEANATQQQWSSFRGSIYGSRETASVFSRGMAGTPPLDAVDLLRFDYMMREHAWATYQTWDRTQQALRPTSPFATGAAPDFLRVICTPGGRVTWMQVRHEFPAKYVADLDRLAGPFARANKVRCVP